MNHTERKDSLYTPELIAFAQVGVEFASLMERGGTRQEALPLLLRLLPGLYSLMQGLPSYFYSPDEDFVEEYITEPAYERVRQRWETILGADDLYLTSFSPEMQYSDSPIAQHLSEQLADIYQHVGNLLGIIREQNDLALPPAIGRCRFYWQEHWGLTLISALGALHQLYVKQSELDAFDIDQDRDLADDYGHDEA